MNHVTDTFSDVFMTRKRPPKKSFFQKKKLNLAAQLWTLTVKTPNYLPLKTLIPLSQYFHSEESNLSPLSQYFELKMAEAHALIQRLRAVWILILALALGPPVPPAFKSTLFLAQEFL